MTRLGFAADHAGVVLKRQLLEFATAAGHSAIDFGPQSTDSVDYPDFAQRLCNALAEKQVDNGVLICGTGIGMSIAANRYPFVRAALCRSEFEARATRAHNDANVLCLGERVTGIGLAEAIFRTFLETPFEGGRHQKRIDKLSTPPKEHS